MSDKELICPLVSIGEDDWLSCQEEECAWWVPHWVKKGEGECAMRSLATAAKEALMETKRSK